MPKINNFRVYDKRTGKVEIEEVATDISEEVIAEAVSDYLETHGIGLEIDENGIIELGGE